jgi:hypothetical protein
MQRRTGLAAGSLSLRPSGNPNVDAVEELVKLGDVCAVEDVGDPIEIASASVEAPASWCLLVAMWTNQKSGNINMCSNSATS